jgi:hypothetical protein
VGTGSREETASKQESRASVLIQSEPMLWSRRRVKPLVDVRMCHAFQKEGRRRSHGGLVGLIIFSAARRLKVPG